jgi:hypothetical protein
MLVLAEVEATRRGNTMLIMKHGHMVRYALRLPALLTWERPSDQSGAVKPARGSLTVLRPVSRVRYR